MPKIARTTADKAIGVKYPIEVNQRIQRLMQELSKRGGGLPVPISYAMVQIALRGLDDYERELGLAKPTKSTKSTAA